jgi:hypothetical protein
MISIQRSMRLDMDAPPPARKAKVSVKRVFPEGTRRETTARVGRNHRSDVQKV